jgi:hypothetical protein
MFAIVAVFDLMQEELKSAESQAATTAARCVEL